MLQHGYGIMPLIYLCCWFLGLFSCFISSFLGFGAFSMYVWPVSLDQCKIPTLLNFKLDDLANCSWSWIFFFVRNGFRLATLPHSPQRQNFLQLLQCCCRSLGSLPDQFSSCLFITVAPYFCLFFFFFFFDDWLHCVPCYIQSCGHLFFIFINLFLDWCFSTITSLWCLAFALVCNGVNVGKILLGQLNFTWG